MDILNSKYLIKTTPTPKSPVSSPAAKKPTSLKLFYTNDWHGQTDNLGGILGASLNFDSSTKGATFDTLKLCAGDSWSGGNVKKNEMILNMLNYMKFDASALGNHEFDAGEEALKSVLSKSHHTKFLSSNLEIEGGVLEDFQHSMIKEVNGNKYGIIGLSPLDLKTAVSVEKIPNVDVSDLEDTIEDTQEEIDKLRAQGVDKIILLSHIGQDLDKKLAQSLSGVDIIVGGHSHDVIKGIKEGENLVRSKSGEPVVILQTGENAKNYGIFSAEFDANGILTKISNTINETNLKRNSIIDKIRDDEVGVSPQIGTIKEIDPMPKDRRSTPCAWTQQLADSMRESLNVDIALINSANMRKVPQVGKLTERDVEESAPMKNNLLTTQMSEAQIVAGIKNAAQRTMASRESYPGLIQCGGVKYEIDSNGKLLSMSIQPQKGPEIKVDINNPSTTRMYSVALDSYVANGKEYPEFLVQNPTQKFNYDKDTLLINKIKKMPNSTDMIIKDDGRLKITQALQAQPKNSNTRNI